MIQVNFFLRASFDVFQDLIRLVMDWQLSHRSCTSFQVPSDFIGVNIAANENPQSDDYILQRLKELDIKQVRMAFTYGSFDSPPQRLLDRVLVQGFDVMLVLVPPREKAHAILFDSTAQNEWIAFIQKVLSRYASAVKLFEIGSTPNRKKWSGYRLRSYLKAWELAANQAQSYAVCLAGPNVQDFEPYANSLLLRAMQRISVAPEVHTDNLFVERVVEPEAYDHRALGRLATNLLKLNLIKKARILKSIGNRAGCQRFYSTCFFWTTKRLSRWSLWPQQKKVDYKSRYLTLAASTGALDRVYWGPLICSRDGLIADGCVDYPDIDHSTFYGEVHGDFAEFTITPAFNSMAYVSKRLQGSFCDTAVNTVTGLHHFSLSRADGKFYHICWCRDGQAISLADLYAPDQLAAAEFIDACGHSVKQPMSISEQVLFVEFPAATHQVFPAVSSPASYHYQDVDVFYLSTPDARGIPWRDQEWRGAYIQDSRWPKLSAEDLHPDTLSSLPEHEVLRDSRNRLWNIADPCDPQRLLTVKLNRPSGIKRWSYYFKPSKGLRHWNNASIMLTRGISTPQPVAYYERHIKSGIEASYYICSFIDEAFSSRHVCAAIEQDVAEFKGLNKHQWMDFLSDFICRMHDQGIVHRDLSVGNLMLKQEKDGHITPYLIDIGRAQISRKGALPRRRLLDLMRICYKLSWPNRELLIQCYNSQWQRRLPWYWRLAVIYYDVKQGTKKYVKRQLKQFNAK